MPLGEFVFLPRLAEFPLSSLSSSRGANLVKIDEAVHDSKNRVVDMCLELMVRRIGTAVVLGPYCTFSILLLTYKTDPPSHPIPLFHNRSTLFYRTQHCNNTSTAFSMRVSSLLVAFAAAGAMAQSTTSSVSCLQ